METKYWIGVTITVAFLAYLVGSGIQGLKYRVTRDILIDCETEPGCGKI